MPEKKNSQTGNFLSWLFKKHFLKLEIIFTPTIDKEPKLFNHVQDSVLLFHNDFMPVKIRRCHPPDIRI